MASDNEWEDVPLDDEEGWEDVPVNGTAPSALENAPITAAQPKWKTPGHLKGLVTEFGQGALKEWGEEFGVHTAAPFAYDPELGPAHHKLPDGSTVPINSKDDLTKIAKKQMRGEREAYRTEHPLLSMGANVLGDVASDAAIALVPGLNVVQKSGPVYNALVGAVTGAGASEAPIDSVETAVSAGAGGLLGGALGKAGKHFPTLTSGALGALGLTGGLLGDKIGLSDADRTQLAAGGGLSGTLAAVSKATRPIADKLGSALSDAKSQIAAKFHADDLAKKTVAEEASKNREIVRQGLMKKADDYQKSFDAKVAPLEKATEKAGKEKISKFKSLVDEKNARRQEQDKSVSEALSRSDAKQKVARAQKEKQAAADTKAQEELTAAQAKSQADDDAAFSKSFENQEAKQEVEDRALSQAYQNEQAAKSEYDAAVERIKEAATKSVRGGGAGGGSTVSPEASAESEMGHMAKQLYADMRLVLGNGEGELDPDVLKAWAILAPDVKARMKATAGEFGDGKAALMERLVAKHREQAAGSVDRDLVSVEKFPKKAAAELPPEPDTGVGVPELADTQVTYGRPGAQEPELPKAKPASVEEPDTSVTGAPDDMRMGNPEMQRRVQDEAMAEAGIPPDSGPRRINEFGNPHPLWHDRGEFLDAAFDRYKNAADLDNSYRRQLLGLEEAPAGVPLDPKFLVTPEERAEIARRLGSQYTGTETTSAVEGMQIKKQLRNHGDVKRWNAGAPLVAEGKTPPMVRPGMPPPELGPPPKLSVEDQSFFEGPPPIPDYIDTPPPGKKPLMNAEQFSRFSGKNAAPADPAWEASNDAYWKRMGFGLQDPAELAPKSVDERVAGELEAAGPRMRRAALLGIARGARNTIPIGLGILSGGKFGALKGATAGAANGIATQWVNQANKDPAVRARLLGAAEKVFRFAPNLQDKYGAFMAEAASRDISAFLARVGFLASEDEEFAQALLQQMAAPEE